MSGGRYGYIERQVYGDPLPLLPAMEEILEQMKTYGEDGKVALSRVTLVVEAMRLSRDLLHELTDAGILHAVEWHASSDWGEDQVRETLRKYNERVRG